MKARYHLVAIGMFVHLSLSVAAQSPLAPPSSKPSVLPFAETSNLPLLGEDIPSVDQKVDFSKFQEVPAESVSASAYDPGQSQSILTQPWWMKPEGNFTAGGQHSLELDQLIWQAIEYSPYVRSLLMEPQIQEAQASQTLGVFDPTPFINSLFHDTSNPVGNTLTTGGPNRLNENLLENSAGVRAKTQTGAQTELVQELNFKDNNSVFFLPHNQSDTRMVMRYTQPLMRGAGATYNRSSFAIASLATVENTQHVTKKIQDHVFVVTSNYWELYVAHAYYQQAERGIKRLSELRNQLEGRSDLDSLRSQLLRADAQIAKQRAHLVRASAQFTTAAAKLRAAVASPELSEDSSILIPMTPPADWPSNITVGSELGLAMNYHPDILATHAKIRAAKVKLQVAENELRPTLNLVMEGYVRGLNGDYNVGSSLGDQFSQGAPSYSAGMTYQRPYRNRAAKAILQEKRLEMQKVLFDLDNTLRIVSADVEGAVANANAAFVELESAVRGTLAVSEELKYLTGRWRNAFLDGSQSGTSLLLDQLLNAEIQLIAAENAWARAQADHMVALARVRLASGSLLPILSASNNTIDPLLSIDAGR
jgi:outer membrane protein